TAGVGAAGAPRALVAADLQYHDRLAGIRGPAAHGHVTLGLGDPLGERRDHPGVGIVDQRLQILRRAEDRLVAGGDDVAEAEAPDVGQHADADGPALRHQRHVAGEPGGIAHLLHVDGAPVVRIEDAHAVGAAQRDPGLAAHPDQLGLTPTALVAVLGESAVVDDGCARALVGHGAEALDHARVGDAQRHHVGLLRELPHARITAL